jgi:hypothetical protein
MAKKDKSDFEKLSKEINKINSSAMAEADFSYDIKPMLEYLKLKYGYLAIQNANIEENINFKQCQLIPADEQGWPIFDFGNLLLTGPGEYALGTPPDKPKLTGTVVNQGWQTAHKLMQVAHQRGWTEIAISKEEGTSVRLNFAAWNAAEDLGINSDYEVLPQDEITRTFIRRSLNRTKQVSPGYQRDSGD